MQVNVRAPLLRDFGNASDTLTLPLQAISTNVAVVYGLQTGWNGTVRILDDGRLWFSGYTFSKGYYYSDQKVDRMHSLQK